MSWSHEAAELAAANGDVKAHRWLGYQQGRSEMIARAEKAEAEVARLRAALDWYANVAHYVCGAQPWEESEASEDSGTRARTALKGCGS